MKTLHSRILALALSGAVLSGGALAQPAGGTQPGTQPGSQPTQPGAKPEARGMVFPALTQPTDERIAAVVKEANKLEAELADGASDKAMSPQVKQYAEQVQTDHKNADKSLDELTGRLRIKPQDNEVAKAIKSMNDQTKTRLKGMEGWAYDKAYLEHEVSFSQGLVDYIDNTLLPNTVNPDLKEMLYSQRAVIAAHLDNAKQIQSTLQGQMPTGTQ